MVVIQIQSQFRNQFWSLIPKNDFRFYFYLTRSIILGTQKCQKNTIFGTQKMPLLMKKNLNLKPFLESVTKTDSKTVFEFEFWPFLRIFAVFGPFWYIQVTFCKVHLSNLAKNGKPQSKNLEINHVVGCDIYTKLSVRNEYFVFSPFTPPYCPIGWLLKKIRSKKYPLFLSMLPK